MEKSGVEVTDKVTDEDFQIPVSVNCLSPMSQKTWGLENRATIASARGVYGAK